MSQCTCSEIPFQDHLHEWSERATPTIARLLSHGVAVPVSEISAVLSLIQLLHDPDRADAMTPALRFKSHHRLSCPCHPSNATPCLTSGRR